MKNTAYLALRAAYLKGPYTLCVSVRRSEFDPYEACKPEDDVEVPEFEPNVKAGSNFNVRLKIPERIRKTTDILGTGGGVLSAGTAAVGISNAGNAETTPDCVTWIVEVASQMIFSSTASISFEVLLGRTEESLDCAPKASVSGATTPPLFSNPFVSKPEEATKHEKPVNVFSAAIALNIQNTKDLWNNPPFPSNAEHAHAGSPKRHKRKTQKVHLVILTHGLHSNVGADMLFMKEAIDKEARLTEEELRKKYPEKVDDLEIVLVRGFEGNSARTERGIKYLGRRLAKYVMTIAEPPPPTTSKSTIHPHLTDACHDPKLYADVAPYRITSISFIGHSLGGLVQTFAIAYIQKEDPKFFENIKPKNFIALASPLLGLSNENPLYVKFALDFGLVGRTGQDLGLTWRAPNFTTAFSSPASKKANSSKPLLRILPTGPAHDVLKKFENRTVYANIVNDGVVPLRTSCLMFLDWKGIGKVEAARRENAANIVTGLVGWGFDQLLGGRNPKKTITESQLPAIEHGSETSKKAREALQAGKSHEVPVNSHIALEAENQNPFGPLMAYLRPHGGEKPESTLPEISISGDAEDHAATPTMEHPQVYGPGTSKSVGSSPVQSKLDLLSEDRRNSSDFDLPRRATVLETASHLLNPPMPTSQFIMDPSSRPQTIFHDRVYHPTDIPPPLNNPGSTLSDNSTASTVSREPRPKAAPKHSTFNLPFLQSSTKPTPLKVDEKIARAYHNDMSWRKVLVKLEPDAHNNMIVRRMFPSAYGWPVVKHVVEEHFGFIAVEKAMMEAEAASPTPTPTPSGTRGRSPSVTPTIESASWTDTAFSESDAYSTTDAECTDDEDDAEPTDEEDEIPAEFMPPRKPELAYHRHMSGPTAAALTPIRATPMLTSTQTAEAAGVLSSGGSGSGIGRDSGGEPQGNRNSWGSSLFPTWPRSLLTPGFVGHNTSGNGSPARNAIESLREADKRKSGEY